MKVFISWSGDKSEAVAKALREWLPLVLHYIEPWLSQSDIQAGDRWSVEIAKELENCNFGIICITRENLDSPWILFESGALAKSMQDGRVIPLLLDLDFKEISGPLAQFQAKKIDNSGIKELVLSLNKSAQAPIPDSRLEKLIVQLWDDFESQISAIPKANIAAKNTRPQGDILEELVASVRAVETRIRDVTDDEPSSRRRRRFKIHPKYIHELMHFISKGPEDPIRLLVFSSLYRDDAPWLHELGLEAYRSIKANGATKSRAIVRRFIDAIELVQRGPIAEELGMDRNLQFMLG